MITAKQCPKCGRENWAAATRCECGYAFTAEQVAGRGHPPDTPPHLIRSVLIWLLRWIGANLVLGLGVALVAPRMGAGGEVLLLGASVALVLGNLAVVAVAAVRVTIWFIRWMSQRTQ